MQTPKRDVRTAVVTMFLSNAAGLDVLEKAIESLMSVEMAENTSDRKRLFDLGRLGGEVLKLKGEVTP